MEGGVRTSTLFNTIFTSCVGEMSLISPEAVALEAALSVVRVLKSYGVDVEFDLPYTKGES